MHKPQTGDIWRNRFYSDTMWNSDRYAEDIYLIHEQIPDANGHTWMGYSFTRSEMRAIQIRDWSNPIGKSCWEKIG